MINQDHDSVIDIAELLRARNAIDARISAVIGRPMAAGHLGEWIASRVFDIELEASAVAEGIDGVFRAGALAGATVNVKWYLKREGLLDTSESARLDYYLVLTGPVGAAASSRGVVRAWCVDAVYLFDASQLRAEQEARGVKRGVASSVRKGQWAAAEIWPTAASPRLVVSQEQAGLLALFRSERLAQ